MTFSAWISALSASSATAAIAIVVGYFLKAKIQKGIQHKFDKELEELRAQLRQEEQRRQADNAARDAQIGALRTGALSGMNSRFAALDQRRLQAAERIWVAVNEMWRERNLALMTKSVKMDRLLDSASQQTSQGEKTRKFAEVVWTSNGMDKIEQRAPVNERLFVSPQVWATFSAYRQMLALPVAQMAAAKFGMEKDFIKDQKETIDLLKSVLPGFDKFIDEYSTSSFAYLIDLVEEKLLKELTAFLEGKLADEQSVKQATEILKKVEEAKLELQPDIGIPDFLKK